MLPNSHHASDCRSVLGGQTHYFEYNSRNLITAIKSDDPSFTTNTFTYNALDQRITKADSTGFTRYIWDGLNILLELDGSGNVKRRYTHGYAAIEGVSSLIDVTAGGATYFYHFDQVGGVRNLTNASQGVSDSYEYSPFGRILAETDAAPNDFTFPATYINLPDLPEIALSPTRAHSALAGRFLQREPIARSLCLGVVYHRSMPFGRSISRGGLLLSDRYQYVWSSPVGWVDVWGCRPQKPEGIKEDPFSGWPPALPDEMLEKTMEDSLERSKPGQVLARPERVFGRITKWTCCDDLTPEQRRKIQVGFFRACSAYRAALQGMKHLAAYKPRGSAGKSTVAKIQKGGQQRLERMLRGALDKACTPGVKIECEREQTGECDPDKQTTAYTRARVWGRWASIHLCPEFFNTYRELEDEAEQNFLDEISHYGGAKEGPSPDPFDDKDIPLLVDFLGSIQGLSDSGPGSSGGGCASGSR